jgi:hypothetical protein
LPPLPQPAHEDQQPHSANSNNGSSSGQNNIPIGAGNGNHPQYNSYNSFVNFAYDQWNSPASNQSFAQQQQQGQ